MFNSFLHTLIVTAFWIDALKCVCQREYWIKAVDKVRRSKFFLKYTEVLDLLCDWYIQILHILKLRQLIVSINWYWTVKVKFYLYKCVRLREYWPVVDQEDTVLSGVTLNFVDCASVFVSSVKKNLSNGQFMIQGHFSNAFSSISSSEILRKWKKYELLW